MFKAKYYLNVYNLGHLETCSNVSRSKDSSNFLNFYIIIIVYSIFIKSDINNYFTDIYCKIY